MTAPFCYHIYLQAPAEEGQVWHTWFGDISSGGYITVQGFLYNFISKMYIFILLSIWYLTAQSWWKWSLLVPLIMVLFQISSVLNDNLQYVDQFEFVHSLPISIPILVIQTIIAYKLYNRNKLKALADYIEEELKSLPE